LILPIASKWISPEEWGRLPGHVMMSFRADKPWLVFGLVREQLDRRSTPSSPKCGGRPTDRFGQGRSTLSRRSMARIGRTFNKHQNSSPHRAVHQRVCRIDQRLRSRLRSHRVPGTRTADASAARHEANETPIWRAAAVSGIVIRTRGVPGGDERLPSHRSAAVGVLVDVGLLSASPSSPGQESQRRRSGSGQLDGSRR
jgi:hypothetical protein